MSANLINADKLSLSRGQRLLFKNISFNLKKGQALYLNGQNGSGKTSLFKILTGFLLPDTGTLEVFTKNIEDFTSNDYCNLLYLGHKTAIKHELTVIENLRLNSEIFDSIKFTEEQLHNALDAVGLLRSCQQLAGKLSVGQKRLVMLARLWLTISDNKTDKYLWLLDEPLTALDTKAVDNLQLLIDKHLSLGGGVVFTSHQSLELNHPLQSLRLGESLL